MSDTCFILMTCHGEVDIDHIIPIPEGKIIIKKSIAPFGRRAYGDLREPKLDDPLSNMIEELDLGPEYAENSHSMELIRQPYQRFHKNNERIRRQLIEEEDIEKCVPYEEYKEICNYAHMNKYSTLDGVEKFYPVDKTCMVLTEYTEYYNRVYSVVNPSVDKIIVNIKNPAVPDIPSEKRKYQDYLQYNLFNPSDMWALLKVYYDSWKNDEELNEYADRVMTNAYPNAEWWDESSIISEENPYSHKLPTTSLDTSILFGIMNLMPQRFIKILDTACAGIKQNKLAPYSRDELFTALNRVHHKITAWGGTKSRNTIKRNKKNNKKKISYKKRKNTRKKYNI